VLCCCCCCFCSHVLPRLDELVKLSLACMEAP
jgi:hypothetical protein